jgi:predicted nucleotidyltransferase
VIIGSCSFGVSLNPNKNYRFFDHESDIDVAVVSEYHFTSAWRALRNLGSEIHRLPTPAKKSVEDHVKKYIYWGTIATDRILHILPFAKEWRIAIETMQNTLPTKGRIVKARIYRDFDSLRAYQVDNLKNLRLNEIEKGVADVQVS